MEFTAGTLIHCEGYSACGVQGEHRKDVFAYVMRNTRVMPRDALRCPAGLVPDDLKAEARRKGRQPALKTNEKGFCLASCCNLL